MTVEKLVSVTPTITTIWPGLKYIFPEIKQEDRLQDAVLEKHKIASP